MTGCTHQPSVESRCSGIKPPATRDGAFVQWVISEGEAFKRLGCWKEHIHWGEEAINIASQAGDNKAMMALSIQLASTYFYLGDYQKCEDSARAANKAAIALDDRIAEVQSLYLLSAAHRARGDSQSVRFAEQALRLCERYVPDDKALKAKVLFNLAAAESDVKPVQLDKAAIHLKDAGCLFKEEGKSHDVLRVGFRLARVQYLRGNYSEANKTIAGLKSYEKSPRNEMIYLYQLAKIEHRQSKWQEAAVSGNQAYRLAVQLDAKKDIERIKLLMAAINKHRFINE